MALGIVLVAIVLLAGCSAGSPIGRDGAVYEGQSAEVQRSSGSHSSGGVGSFYSEDGTRVVVRTAEMELRVEEFETAFEKLRTIVDRHDGYLGDRSQTSTGEWDRATITIRVPAAQFPATRDAIVDIGRVKSETVDAKDFTTEYRQRQHRIEDLRDEEQKFEALLDNASNASEAMRIRSELRDIRQQLDSLTAQQSRLEQREAFSTITVTLTEPTDRKPPATYTSE
ncbi:MAG: DUF4349 domain-containing protein [Halococcoides sp.]